MSVFKPSAYNQPDAKRVNLRLFVTPAVASSLADFDDYCVTTSAAQSPRLFGSQLSVEEVRNDCQPTLRVHEAAGSQSPRLKMNRLGRAAIRISRISAPPSRSQCSTKYWIRLTSSSVMVK